MEKLKCPDCQKNTNINQEMTGVDVTTCPHCGAAYVVMYIAGFNDGLRNHPKAESAEKSDNKQMVPCNHEKGYEEDGNFYCEECGYQMW